MADDDSSPPAMLSNAATAYLVNRVSGIVTAGQDEIREEIRKDHLAAEDDNRVRMMVGYLELGFTLIMAAATITLLTVGMASWVAPLVFVPTAVTRAYECARHISSRHSP